MGRRSEEATNARLMCPSLRVAGVLFCAEEDAAFFVLVEGAFLLDVWRVKPAGKDTRSTKRENRKRLSTDLNYRGKPAPMSETSLSAKILINSWVK
jgi:hypothetical protein